VTLNTFNYGPRPAGLALVIPAASLPVALSLLPALTAVIAVATARTSVLRLAGL
jgi:hypothetical protein